MKNKKLLIGIIAAAAVVVIAVAVALVIFLGGNSGSGDGSDTSGGSVTPQYNYARGEGTEFVPVNHYPTNDLIICAKNVLDFGAKADGVTDDTKAFQDALYGAVAMGGGTVYVPEGTYYLASPIRIPDSVVLCGDWVSPEEQPVGTRGTVIVTDYMSADETVEKGLIKLGSSSGLRNVVIYYKNQSVESPKKMAPTVWSVTQSQPSVENVTFVNSYKAISFGEGKEVNCSLAGLVNVYITALNQGVVISNSYDVSRSENLHVSPQYWAENVIAPMTEQQKTALYDYTFNNCVGVTLYRGDATGLYDSYFEFLKTGILLADDPHGSGVTSGAITLTEIKNCDVGVMVENAHGIGTALTGFKASADRDCTAAVKTGYNYIYNTKVEDGSITGKYKNAAVVNSNSTVTFTDIDFNLDTSDYVFNASAGTVSCVNCTFDNGNLFTDNNGRSVGYFNGCKFRRTLKNSITEWTVLERNDAETKTQPISGYHEYKKELPQPATRNIVSITEYGAKGDRKTDCTVAIQKALDDMAAKGGGIVLIPSGRYVVKGHLTVPSGVELAGMLGVWCYSGASFTNSCLLLYAGADDPNGKAAINLEEGSGIRGFLAWYPEQNYDDFVEYSYAVRSLGPNTYAVNVNICNAYQYMDFGTYDSTGHYVRNCAGIAIKTGMLVGSNSGDGWIENVHLNQHQAYELSIHYQQGGYPPERFTELVFQKFINQTEYFVFGYNENEHVLGAFGLGAKAVFRFADQNGKSTSGTFIQCGADGCRNSYVIEQAGNLTFIAPGDVALGDAEVRTYITTASTFTGILNVYGGAGFGSPTNCFLIEGGTVNINTFTFASANNAMPMIINGGKSVNLFNCVIPLTGNAAKSQVADSVRSRCTEAGTLFNGGSGYTAGATF